ncbi:MAG TPA: hypothetical protein VGJ16_03385 [Pirellulales bacterium]|jgi:hypothetical protein
MSRDPRAGWFESRARLGLALALVLYFVMVAALVISLTRLRESALRELDTPEARQQWTAWREAAPNQAEQGPVRRQPPRSAEPPELVLLRDYFAVVLTGSLLFCSLLFAAIALAVRGVFSKPESQIGPVSR